MILRKVMGIFRKAVQRLLVLRVAVRRLMILRFARGEGLVLRRVLILSVIIKTVVDTINIYLLLF